MSIAVLFTTTENPNIQTEGQTSYGLSIDWDTAPHEKGGDRRNIHPEGGEGRTSCGLSIEGSRRNVCNNMDLKNMLIKYNDVRPLK